jgi:predicted dehydrogenase
MAKQKSRKIKLGIVGLGYWGPNLLRNFLKINQAQVVLVCDQDGGRLQKTQSSYPQLAYTDKAQDIFVNPEIEAVCLCTPLATHFTLAGQALRAGKHVLVEKPLTQTSQQAKNLINLAKVKNKILMVDHTFIYSLPVVKIKELIEQKVLGKLYYFDSQRINLGLVRPDSNVIFDLAPHDLSILDFWFGNQMPNLVVALGTRHLHHTHEDTAHILLEYPGGLVGHIYVSWLSPLKVRRMLVGGDKKMVFYDDVEPSEKIKLYDKSVTMQPNKITPFNPFYRDGDVLIPKLDQVEPLEKVCQHFIDCIVNKQQPLSDGLSGWRVAKILEAINLSLKNNGKKVLIKK